MSESYINVPDAALVKTDAYRDAQRAVELACERNAIVALCGPAGTGKTRALDDAFADRGDEQPLYWRPNTRVNDKQTVVAILMKATGVNYARERRFDASDRLIEFFAERPRPLGIDEAHNLTPAALEALRHIYKQPETQLPLVLSGGPPLLDAILTNAEFRRLVAWCVEFEPLSPTQVLKVIPEWHRLYEDADELQLTRINEQHGHGNFGHWSLFTANYLTEAARLDRPATVQDDVIELVLDMGAALRRREQALLARREKRQRRTKEKATRQAKAPTRWS